MKELKNSVELNDEELDEVAGGVKFSGGFRRFKADNGTKGVGDKSVAFKADNGLKANPTLKAGNGLKGVLIKSVGSGNKMVD